jgi:hypothetical protein
MPGALLLKQKSQIDGESAVSTDDAYDHLIYQSKEVKLILKPCMDIQRISASEHFDINEMRKCIADFLQRRSLEGLISWIIARTGGDSQVDAQIVNFIFRVACPEVVKSVVTHLKHDWKGIGVLEMQGQFQ